MVDKEDFEKDINVPNKEIIIDGINVSECEYLQYKGCEFAQCLIKMASFDLKCEDYNCYYKQLSGKAQECEKWKHQAELGSETTDRLVKQLEEKEQQCEQLKSELHLYKTWYRAKHGDVKNILGTYYEALKEIKNITKDIIENDCYENSDTKVNKILGIINKAKGIINDR